ncbi:glycosyltransferase family 2 protein [soil metagenome]
MIESWNLGEDLARVERGLWELADTLAPQVADHTAEVVITHRGLGERARASIDRALVRPITWVLLPGSAGYYEHKNRGFDATTGDIVAFLDGDCAPSASWLAALIAPIAGGEAKVAAGMTSYPGELGPLANQLDFPYYGRGPGCVRNFFANNVAFSREVFAARRYPTIEPMFHGQCQVLGLQLLTEAIAIRFAAGARVTHAWPEDLAEWLEVRLLKGADTVSLLPYVVAAYAPRASPMVERLGALPALSILGLRAVTGTWAALRKGPVWKGLGLVACVTVLDALGAAAAPAVYRRIG